MPLTYVVNFDHYMPFVVPSDLTGRRKKRESNDEPPVMTVQGCYGSEGSNMKKVHSGKKRKDCHRKCHHPNTFFSSSASVESF